MKKNKSGNPAKPKMTITITFADEAQKQKLINAAKKENRSMSNFVLMKSLLTIVIVISSLSVNAQDTLSLPKQTYTEIYKGLKAEEYYRQANTHCIEIANSLNVIIQQQNDSLQLSMSRLDEVNYELDYLNHQYQEAIKERPTPWYKSPWLWSGLGLLTGILITK